MRRSTAEQREGAHPKGVVRGCTAEEGWAVLGKRWCEAVLQIRGKEPVLGEGFGWDVMQLERRGEGWDRAGTMSGFRMKWLETVQSIKVHAHSGPRTGSFEKAVCLQGGPCLVRMRTLKLQ